MQRFLNSFLPGWETGALWSDIRKKDKPLMNHDKREKRWWTWQIRPEVKPTYLFYQTASKTTVLQLETIYLDWLIMAPHSSTLAWKIPWTEEPGRLQYMGSRRVGHDWATSLSLFTFMHWRRKLQPTPVFLPGESQGSGSLVGCHLWGCTQLDTIEVI